MQSMHRQAAMQSYSQVCRYLTKDKNFQLYAIVKHVHQMLRNLIKNVKLQDNLYLASDDPWSGILTAALFAMCSMYHTSYSLHDAWPAHIWERYDT